MPDWIDVKISLGNILTIASVIVGLTTGWMTLASGVQQNSADILKIDGRVSAQADRLDRTITELQAYRLSETTLLTELRTDMRYLREAVDQLRASTGKGQ
jgi:TolA-binding protein